MTSMLCSLDFLAAAASFQLCKELNAKVSSTEDETNVPNSTINETESSHSTIPMSDDTVKAENYNIAPLSEIIEERSVQIIKQAPYSNDLRSNQYSQDSGYTTITSISPIRPSNTKTAGDPLSQSRSATSLIKENGKMVSNLLSHNTDLKIVRYDTGREGPSQRRKRLNQNYKYRETLMAQGIYPLHRPDSTCACSLCGETFRKEMLMWRHGVKHLDGKPFRCDICYSRFNRSDTLARHVHCFHELHH